MIFEIVVSSLVSVAGFFTIAPFCIREYERAKTQREEELYRRIAALPSKMIITTSTSSNGHKIESKRFMTIKERIQSGER